MTTSSATVPCQVASSGLAGPHPGKQPLTKKQINALFNSAEKDETWRHSYKLPPADLSLLYASVDSVASMGSMEFWKSKDISNIFASSDTIKMPLAPPVNPGKPFASIDAKGNVTKQFSSIDAAVGLISAANPHSFIPIFASKDSVFASIEPLPFKSVDSVAPLADSKTPDVGIYESREWLPFYQGSHRDIAYRKELFNTSELVPKKTKVKAKFYDEYLRAVRAPEVPGALPRPEPTNPAKVARRGETKPSTKKEKKPPTKRGEPKEKVYVEPLPTDIISGRGGKSNAWPGNKRYRELIELSKESYNDGAKYEKTIKSQEVVDLLLAEGRRFLKLEEAPGLHSGDYYLMTKNQARKKAGQALREENTPASRKKKREFYGSKMRQQTA